MENETAVKRVQVPPHDEECDGVWVKLSGRREYLVPALNFRALKKFQSKIGGMAAIEGAPNEEQMDTILEIAHAALKRNYPTITVEQLTDMIDMANFLPLFMAIVNTSGLERGDAKPGEA